MQDIYFEKQGLVSRSRISHTLFEYKAFDECKTSLRFEQNREFEKFQKFREFS